MNDLLHSLRSRVAALSPVQRQLLVDQLQSPPQLRVAVRAHADRGDLSAQEIKEHLRARLPAYAVPSHVLISDELPRLPNGKIDRANLPLLDVPVPDQLPVADSDPANECECTLLEIWQEVLGTPAISIDDDFFEIGGDSILSIQIISRARSAGLAISPGDLVDHPTIARLALHAGALSALDQARDSTEDPGGPIPLTPIQEWFLQRELSQPTHWNQAMALPLDPSVSKESLEAIIQEIARRHGQLRAGVRRTEGRWVQELSTDPISLDVISHSDDDRTLKAALHKLQTSLAFDGRPLVRFALVETKPVPHLIVVAHHLVIDSISWQILHEDFTNALRELPLPSPTDSFSRWSNLLAESSAEPTTSEGSYWTPSATTDCGILPRDFPSDPGEPLVEEHAETHRIKLTGPQATVLFKDSAAAYNTRAEDLLIAALARTLNKVTGKSQFRIGVERHGRDALANLDLSRTIGWFTSFFPLRTDLTGALDAGHTIKHVKEALRRVPRSGIGYGQIRYGCDEELAQAVAADAHAEEILFNYLGASPRPGQPASPASLAATLEETSRSPHNQRSHLLEINCSKQGEELHMDWIYNSRAHTRNTVRDWAEIYLKELGALIDHCLQQNEPSFTPSDFPDAEMNQEELDAFLEDL